MNRTIITLGIVPTILALTAATLAQTPAQDRATRRENARGTTPDAAGRQQPPGQRQQYQRLQQQIEELKTIHQDLIAQLQKIHNLAVKEKASETAEQIQTLISKRQESFQNALQELQQQQFQLQRAGRVRPQRGAGQDQAQGKQAPEFELDSFDGRTVKLSDFKDKIVVLEWMNPECPFSRYHYETTPTMANLAKKYQDKEVVWLAINSTSFTTPQANQEFAQKHKLPFPILDDRSGRVGRLYGAQNTPHMFVIDKNGVIAYEGAIDNAPLGKQQPGGGTVNYVDKAVSELLAGQDVSLAATPPYGCTVKYAQQ